MHFASMSLGIFDFLIDWLTSFLMWIVEWTLGLIMDIIGVLLYDLASSILYIVDLIQQMFRKLCGMDTIWINGKPANYVDPVISVVTDKAVLQVLLALTIVAIAMVIVATIIQIIRTEFSTEGSKNTKGQIFGTALKSLMLFAIVPITCVGGLILSNALLRTLDKATSGAEQSTMGAQIAISSLSSAKKNSDWHGESNFLTMDDNGNPKSGYNYRDTDDIKKYYDLGECNFFILIGSAIMAVYILIMASFGLIMRLYKIAVLFMVSPPIVGLMPLYDKAFIDWRKTFIGQVVGAYGTVVSLNLMFQLMPIVNNIDLFPAGSYGNDIAHLLFTLTALFLMKDLPKTLSKFLGEAADITDAGSSAAKQVGGAAMKVGMMAAGGVGGLAMKGAGLAAKGVGAIGGGIAKAGASKGNKFWTGFGKTMSGTVGGAGKLADKLGGNLLGKSGKAIDDGVKGISGFTGGAFNAGGLVSGGKALGGLIKKGTSAAGAGIMNANKKAALNKAIGEENKIFKEKQTEYEEKRADIEQKRNEALHDKNLNFGQRMKVVKQANKDVSSLAQQFAADSAEHTNKIENMNVGETRLSGFVNAINTGGASTINNIKNQEKINNAVGDMNSAYNGVAGATGPNALDPIRHALSIGDGLAATKHTDSIINALNEVADKTEYQAELLQQLVQLNSSIGKAGSAKGELQKISLDSIGDLMTNVNKEANGVVNVTSNYNISQGAGDISSKIDDIAEKIASSTGKKVEKIKSDILREQKQELENIKDKLNKKK